MPDDPRSRPGPSPDNQQPKLIPRRKVLQFAGTAIAVASLPAIEGCAVDADAPKDDGVPPDGELNAGVLATALTVDVLRKEDLVVLKLAFVNLDLRDKTKTPPPAGLLLAGNFWLGRTDPNAAAYIVALHQPQHVFEEAFDEGGELDKVTNTTSPTANVPSGSPPPPVKHRMARQSRLAFLLPANVTAIPYELEPVLAAMASYPLNVVATATPQSPDPSNLVSVPLFAVLAAAATSAQKTKRGVKASRIRKASTSFAASNPDANPRVLSVDDASRGFVPAIPTEPGELQTSIELPFRLQLSPNVYAKFVHANAPVASPKTARVELWHSRLATKESWQKTVRAVWTRDPGFVASNPQAIMQGANTPPAQVDPFYGDMFPKDRGDVVHLTTNSNIKDVDGQPRARAVPTKSLMLSSLGGWLDAHGSWKGPSMTPGVQGGGSLIDWDHHRDDGSRSPIRPGTSSAIRGTGRSPTRPSGRHAIASTYLPR